jgi:two-component system, LytTR family, sensor histidine kinase AgrC
MFQITLITMVLISFPEAMLIASLSLLIVGVKPTIKQLALFGVLQAFFSYLVRLFAIDLNIIFLIQLFFSSINMYFVFAIPYAVSVIAMLIGITIYMGIEAVSTITLFSITGLTIQKNYASELLRLMFFLPQGAVTIV